VLVSSILLQGAPTGTTLAAAAPLATLTVGAAFSAVSRYRCLGDHIIEGRADQSTLDLLEQLAKAVRKGSLCGLGKTAPNPVLSTLRYFRPEVEAHVFQKRCPTGRCKALRTPEIRADLCANQPRSHRAADRPKTFRRRQTRRGRTRLTVGVKRPAKSARRTWTASHPYRQRRFFRSGSM
jgi:hypothetical protein